MREVETNPRYVSKPRKFEANELIVFHIEYSPLWLENSSILT